MDEAELAARATSVLAALRDWVGVSRKNLDRYTDIFHEADEGKRHQAVLEIVVGELGLTPEDAAIIMGAMKAEWRRSEEFMSKVLGPEAPLSPDADDDCPF